MIKGTHLKSQGDLKMGKFGAFFSRTDVSATEYGEGSFDKGIKLVSRTYLGGDSLTL